MLSDLELYLLMAIVGSNIEVYSCLNPLYYSIERKYEKSDEGLLTLKRDYEIFKNLDENLFIDLRKRILNDVFKHNEKNKGAISTELVRNTQVFDESQELDIEKLEQYFYSGNHFLKDYMNEEDTMFLYLDSFESDATLYYKETDLKTIYEKLKLKTQQTPKRACRIRVFSRSSDITKETLKQTIDLDIQNFKRELERYDSRTPGFKKIEKVRIISDYERNLDYLALNVEKMVKVSDKKNYIELVEYANNRLKELFKSELNIIDDRDGRELGKVSFFVFPTLQKPGFLDSKKSVKDFLSIVKNDELKQLLTKTKRNIEKSDIEFQKYVKQLREKLIKGEVVKQLDDFLKNFFELELYPGVNGDGIINVTKDLHEKRFRFKKGSKGYVSFNAIEIELIVKMRQVMPTAFTEFSILTRENIEIGIMTVTLKYGEKENTLVVESFNLYESSDYKDMVKKRESRKSKRKRESKLQSWMSKQGDMEVLIGKFKEAFKYKDGKSELIGRTGIITRKTRIVKNVLQVEAYNLASININKPFYIIPLISFDDKDVAEYLKKESPEKYDINNEDLVEILTNTQECYKFYLNVSTNNPDKVYDREKYSDTFKDLKIKENVKFIISKLLQKNKVFRPKIVQGEKPFRGIYKMIGYELDESNRVRIIKKGVDAENKKGEIKSISGTIVQKEKVVLQVDPITFVHYEANSDSVLAKFPPRFQYVTLKQSDETQLSRDNVEDQLVKQEYLASKVFYEKFNTEQNIIRVPVQLYISQNPPKDHKDFECEIRKNKLRRSFQKLESEMKVYQDRLPVGKYVRDM